MTEDRRQETGGRRGPSNTDLPMSTRVRQAHAAAAAATAIMGQAARGADALGALTHVLRALSISPCRSSSALQSWNWREPATRSVRLATAGRQGRQGQGQGQGRGRGRSRGRHLNARRVGCTYSTRVSDEELPRCDYDCTSTRAKASAEARLTQLRGQGEHQRRAQHAHSAVRLPLLPPAATRSGIGSKSMGPGIRQA